MIVLPPPVVEFVDPFFVVRDDLLPGGTKRRALPIFFDHHDEYVYASPVQGAAQLALAYTAREHSKKATIFCAERKTLHPNTSRVIELGASVVQVPMGFLSNITAKSRAYCEQTGAKMLPFGLDDPAFVEALANVAASIDIKPAEVWSIASSGVLTRALQRAWPDARFFGVAVGHEPSPAQRGFAHVYIAPEKYDQPAKHPPPFPSCSNYDAKLWQFVTAHASPGALIWNVAL